MSGEDTQGSELPLAPDDGVMPAISVNSLAKRYGEVVALDGVDLEVPSGSIFGLVGPNGAGKTTLIRTLVGAINPDGGSILVDGVDPSSDRYSARSRVGYMPQESVLYSDLTARENVAFFYRGHRRDRAERAVERALAFADLEGVADRLVRTLSGGIRQRVSLAATLAHGPPVLLLDEPTAGVDPELRHAFWQGFRRLTADGVSIFITTHQMDEVVHCDRVALLRHGQILAEAEPGALLSSGGVTIRVHLDGEVVTTAVGSDRESLPLLLREYGLDASVTAIEVETPTLEEVILGLIDRDDAREAS